MDIQSLSVVVPNKKCINDCEFCVSKMHDSAYKNSLYGNTRFFDLYFNDYLKRLMFARDNGCNTVMLTGNSEPQQNIGFLRDFGLMMRMLPVPFRNIEMQTTGVLLDDAYLRFLRNHVGVNIISLSLASFDSAMNSLYTRMPACREVDINWLCSEIKRYDFGLRLSLNLTDDFNSYTDNPELLFNIARQLGADQITLRILYVDPRMKAEQCKWVESHRAQPELINSLVEYILKHGEALEILEFGATRYDIMGMSVVVDGDCMANEAKQSLKYLILREDCKLYTKWHTKGSLLF